MKYIEKQPIILYYVDGRKVFELEKAMEIQQETVEFVLTRVFNKKELTTDDVIQLKDKILKQGVDESVKIGKASCYYNEKTDSIAVYYSYRNSIKHISLQLIGDEVHVKAH